MSTETNMELMEKTVETGMEVVTKATKNNGLMKRVGIGFGYAAAGAVVYKCVEMLIDFGKSKFGKKKKNDDNQSETTEEQTESSED